jgi:hypothetical protein
MCRRLKHPKLRRTFSQDAQIVDKSWVSLDGGSQLARGPNANFFATQCEVSYDRIF